MGQSLESHSEWVRVGRSDFDMLPCWWERHLGVLGCKSQTYAPYRHTYRQDTLGFFYVFSGNYTNLTKTLASRYQLTSFACSDLESNTDHYSAYGVTQNGISMAVGDFIHHDTTAGGCPQFYEIVNGNINMASLLVKCNNSDFSFTRFVIQGCPAVFVRFLGLAHPLQSHNFLSFYYLQLCILCLVKGPLYPLTSSSFRLSVLPCIQT